jgi:putative endonuclease
MSLFKKNVGKQGEDIAAAFLQKHHYRILEQNFRTRNGEVDIIALDTSEKEPVLCFIEVKTRHSTAYGTPLEAISYYKLQALRRTAVYYQATHKNLPSLLRLDAVSILLADGSSEPEIELVKNIS